MMRRLLLCVVLSLSAVPLAEAQPAAAPKLPLGTWKRDQEGVNVAFAIKQTSFKCILEIGGISVDVDVDYAVSRDGVVFGRVAKISEVEGGPVGGHLFSWKYKLDKGKLIISDLSNCTAEARRMIEGEYILTKDSKDKQ